ncbi:YiiX/YebB-like N1pC/P60 family cysteine hydrolase [Zhouia sp. PK063]|uniref:YiiX/YebB-like N1pC/P60 family cysteine hydrolase n=1 Tax=Zhouia sp. PK063 TaxID=3373602 RepID=UPI00379165DC
MKIYINCILICFFSCIKLHAQEVKLQNGDILFREKVSEKLSEAIDNVTQTDSNTHFSHIGMVEIKDGKPYVLHAAPENGSCIVSLEDFISPDKESRKVVAYRLKNEFKKAIPLAIRNANKMLGKPYNSSYVMNDSSYYCSDFIYRAFANDSIFKLNPMTFKDPKTHEFSSAWIDFYKNLHMKIPEGKLGCNPNGMAASNKLIRLGVISK